jgi:hypothetical protein
MSAFRWSDNERNWNGFLVDLCVQEVTPILRQMGYNAHVTTEKQDHEPVLEAWDDPLGSRREAGTLDAYPESGGPSGKRNYPLARYRLRKPLRLTPC